MEHTSTATADRPVNATDAAADFRSNSDESFGHCRQRLISYLVKLNHALNEDLQDLSQALVSRFCDSLVDYLSAGHFQVFQRIVPSAHDYAAIESTTRVAMTFNDRFGNIAYVNIPEVKAALEQLALILGTRFEVEDDIICSEST
jgi:regulator of sigma D